MDLPNDGHYYDYPASTNQYYPGHLWGLAIDAANTQDVDPRRDMTSMHTRIHALGEPTMAEQTVMGDWHYQQMQHQQHQSHQMTHPPLSIPQFQHIPPQMLPSTSMAHPSVQYQHVAQIPPPADSTYAGMFNALSVPAHMNLLAVSPPGMVVPVSVEQAYIPTMQNVLEANHAWTDLHSELVSYQTTDVGPFVVSPYQHATSSPTGSHLEILSQPSSLDEHGWNIIDGRHSFGSSERSFFVEPTQVLHDSTISEASYSDVEPLQTAFLSNLDMGVTQAVWSPTSLSDSDFEAGSSCHKHRHSEDHDSLKESVRPGPVVPAIPAPFPKGSSPIRSPGSQASSASPTRKTVKKTLIVARGTERVAKKTSPNGKPDEKKVGKRKGPLKPEQRKQASEIRKLRACLRCKFLKKTCDKGEPCAGCQPSHARLWQVPCTRIDIKEIGYFLKDKKFDYERHVTLGFSVGNIKGFSDVERRLFITHGYGHMLPVTAREVYLRDDRCMLMDWSEADSSREESSRGMTGYEVYTAKLSAGSEGISTTMLSDYLDRHIDGTGTFERFVNDYFDGTPFLSQMLKVAYQFYFKTHSKMIKKALKLMLAYSLTVHVTMVEGVPAEEAMAGKIEDASSKFYGKTMAPVMINFQVKCAMADMWRELHKDVLEELSVLYSSVYSGDKLKNWPTIFILASVLLAVWEYMQFDCRYRVPDEAAVDRFCADMESTPVGVVVGLFSAISQKLPSILEWDTQKHHTLLGSDWNVCNTMTEVREHVSHYGTSRASAV